MALLITSFTIIAFQATWKASGDDDIFRTLISYFLVIAWAGSLLGFGCACENYSAYRTQVFLFGILGANAGLGWAVFMSDPTDWYTYVLCALWPMNIAMLGSAAFSVTVEDVPVAGVPKATPYSVLDSVYGEKGKR
jgi:hypothetical protein